MTRKPLTDSEPLDLRDVVEIIPALVVCVLPDGSVEFVNRAWQEYTGYSLQQLKESGWQNAIYQEDLARFTHEGSVAFSAGRPLVETEVRVRRADGQYRWFVVKKTLAVLRTGNSKPSLYTLVAFEDINERKQSQIELEKAFEEIKTLRDQLYKENLALREEIDQASMFEEIVGSSPALQEVLSRIARVAPRDSTVLITGETGTGKELVARAIHKRSQRSGRAFVSVNCAAIAQSLIASELFGHEKGAFTGALQRHLGRFELAEGGTIFLDEIGDLPPETQVALLRVLQEREFERVGGIKPIASDVRVVAATNRDLQAAVDAGSFRLDLFYRLNVFPIQVPPLRDRKEDIPTLVDYFVERYAGRAARRIRRIERKTLELFQSYPWPGNIRELQNVIERSVILCTNDVFSVDESWLPREAPHRDQPVNRLTSQLLNHEKEMIEAALAQTKGRVAGPAGAAAKLGIPPSTLESKIKTLRVIKSRFRT